MLHTIEDGPSAGTVTLEAGSDTITFTDAEGNSREVALLNIDHIDVQEEAPEVPQAVADGNLLLINNDHRQTTAQTSESIMLRAGMHRIVIPYWQADAEYNLSVQVRGPGIDGEVELGSSNLRSFLNRNQPLDPSPGIDTEGYRLPELTAEAAEGMRLLRRARYELFIGGTPDQMQHVGSISQLNSHRQGTTSSINTQMVTDPVEGFALVFEALFIAEFDGNYTFTISSDDGSQLYFGQVDEFVVDLSEEQTEIETPWIARLSNRGVARGELVSIGDQQLVMSLPLGQGTGTEMRLGLSHAVSLWSQGVDTSTLNREDESPSLDTLYFRDRNDPNDILAFNGRIVSLDEEQISFEYRDQVRQINRTRVVGMVFNHSERPDAPSPGFHQTLRFNASGQVLPARLVSLGETVAFEVIGGEVLEVPRYALNTIGFENGRLLDLTLIEPTATEAIPYFGLAIPHRVGTNFSGGAVRLATGDAYERSLAVHSLSRLHYRLDRPCERFRATFGLMVPGGNQGNVTARVLGDGEVLWQREDITLQDGPIEVDVPLAGVERLVLEVDFGQGQGVGDRAAWCNPVLIYANQQ